MKPNLTAFCRLMTLLIFATAGLLSLSSCVTFDDYEDRVEDDREEWNDDLEDRREEYLDRLEDARD